MLNPAQLTAVEHRGGPLLVLAGAGTGKTRVITHRVVSLLEQGVLPWAILAVTFTNKAAHEMRDRILRLCSDRRDSDGLWIGTFHSIGARILRQNAELAGLTRSFSIYDMDDQASIMARVLKDQGVSDRIVSVRGMLTYVDRLKNRGLGPEHAAHLGYGEPLRSIVEAAYTTYQKRLQAANAVDFGDLLMLPVRLLQRAPGSGMLADLDPIARLRTRFEHVVVDEYQDTNPIQADFVEALSQRAELCVVGDDDQAIYGWRGADVAQILGFPDRHPQANIVRLEQNYRSTAVILRCADAIIASNRGRLGKTLWSDLGEGDPVRLLLASDERDEARFIAREIADKLDEGANPEEFAVFYRTHAQSRVLEDEMRKMGLGCRIVGGVAFYERMEVKDVLSYLAVLENPESDVHLARVINRPTRGIGAKSVQRLLEWSGQHEVSLWQALEQPERADLSRAAAGRIRGFRAMIENLREHAKGMQLDALAEMVLEHTGYRESLAADGDDESRTRLENLQELLGNMNEFVTAQPEASLFDYLELVSLVAGERAEGARGRAVTLMTIHSAKGLEFDAVYLTGMEERVFPHSRVLDDPDQLEEECRLAYVAVTRARKQLTMSMVQHRRLYGQVLVGRPSRFLRNLPRDAVQEIGTQRIAHAFASDDRATSSAPRERSWDDDIVYEDASATEEGISLYVGMTVRHGRYGEGQLVGWSGSGRDLKLQLRFSTHGTKTILARYCEPE